MLDITDTRCLAEAREAHQAEARPVILLPYLGELSGFARLSLRMLARNAEMAELILLSDRPSPDIAGIRHVDFASAFDAGNPLGISFPALAANPYKICDLKPFLNLLFPSLTGTDRRWGFADIDCLYADRVLAPLARAEGDRPRMHGQFGHLMIGDAAAFRQAQEVLLEADRRFPAYRMFDPGRHLALDEFLFLHVVLAELDAHKTIAWEPGFPGSIGDVEPFHRLPLIGKTRFRFFFVSQGRLFGVTVAGDEVEFDYIHLQKRRVILDAGLTGNEDMRLYPLKDGSMRLVRAGTADEAPPDVASNLADWRYALAVNGKRLRHRLKNHGLRSRPSLSRHSVRDILRDIA
ncbi:DUF6625 family protein [Afifella pfennigii]|uniref:DUF6625 family protein n=1 Tax=Afifella pfennigii TaxID=209897 RepID=UPI00054DE050|nr:DUF6625 family protein [Afifella pfennigii]